MKPVSGERGSFLHSPLIVPPSVRAASFLPPYLPLLTSVSYLANHARSRLYDRITSDAPEYYLFQDELNLLKTHGDQIARSMGFPGSNSPLRNDGGDNDYAPVKPWKPARWGDVDVGKWNNGVNGEEGLGGGWEKGWDVVELGAG
jgi:hypothetical protein